MCNYMIMYELLIIYTNNQTSFHPYFTIYWTIYHSLNIIRLLIDVIWDNKDNWYELNLPFNISTTVFDMVFINLFMILQLLIKYELMRY